MSEIKIQTGPYISNELCCLAGFVCVYISGLQGHMASIRWSFICGVLVSKRYPYFEWSKMYFCKKFFCWPTNWSEEILVGAAERF